MSSIMAVCVTLFYCAIVCSFVPVCIRLWYITCRVYTISPVASTNLAAVSNALQIAVVRRAILVIIHATPTFFTILDSRIAVTLVTKSEHS